MNRKRCATAAILGYASVLVSIAGYILGLARGRAQINVYSLILLMFVALLCVLLHALKSRACAVLLLAYGLLNTVATFIFSGVPGGLGLVAAAIVGVIGAFGCQKEWKRYQEG